MSGIRQKKSSFCTEQLAGQEIDHVPYQKPRKFDFDSADYYKNLYEEQQKLLKQKVESEKQNKIDQCEHEESERAFEEFKSPIKKKSVSIARDKKKVDFDSADYFIQKENERIATQQQQKEQEDTLEEQVRAQAEYCQMLYILQNHVKKIRSSDKKIKFDSADYFLEKSEEQKKQCVS